MKNKLYIKMWKTKNEMTKGELLYLRLGYYMITMKKDKNIYYKVQ